MPRYKFSLKIQNHEVTQYFLYFQSSVCLPVELPMQMIMTTTWVFRIAPRVSTLGGGLEVAKGLTPWFGLR